MYFHLLRGGKQFDDKPVLRKWLAAAQCEAT
jgi:hypothetical protein